MTRPAHQKISEDEMNDWTCKIISALENEESFRN